MYIDVYKDKAHEWRWRFRGENHETMADSGEGYKNREDMFRALETVTGSWTSLFTYFDTANEKQVVPVLNRQDGSTISIRDEADYA